MMHVSSFRSQQGPSYLVRDYLNDSKPRIDALYERSVRSGLIAKEVGDLPFFMRGFILCMKCQDVQTLARTEEIYKKFIDEWDASRFDVRLEHAHLFYTSLLIQRKDPRISRALNFLESKGVCRFETAFTFLIQEIQGEDLNSGDALRLFCYALKYLFRCSPTPQEALKVKEQIFASGLLYNFLPEEEEQVFNEIIEFMEGADLQEQEKIECFKQFSEACQTLDTRGFLEHSSFRNLTDRGQREIEDYLGQNFGY